MTLLSVAQDVAQEVGLPKPSTIINNTSGSAVRLLTILNGVGKEIAEEYPWTALQKEVSFVTVATEIQSTLPADFEYILNDTMYNRTQRTNIFGPYRARQWQRSKASIASGIYSTFRIRGKRILFTPVPTAGNTVYYEYLSKYWVDTDADTDGEALAFSDDDDTTVFDEELLRLGGIARLREALSLDYAESFNRFNACMELKSGRDGGRARLSFSALRMPALTSGNIPDTGFGS